MAIFLSIKVHFQGMFINKVFYYSDGVHHVFENIDFAGMSYNKFVGFLERFTQEMCEKLYYYQPYLQIPKDIAYRCGVQVPVYMDHFGTTVHVTKANENENEYNWFVKSNMSIEREEGIDLTDFMSPQTEQHGRRVSQANGNKDSTEGDPKYDEDENIPDVKGKKMFNEDISWKKRIPILGSIVNYRWIGSHFTKEALENQKFNVRMLKEEVKIKFGIEWKIMQSCGPMVRR
uniref:Uncharacterized protein n=1 Tax=Lactuca sativa TaxID=4236 RepID=A0A9R1UNP3_LACSA|nr:hypothetical protein LSAT_V11C800445900 [Lactuca sativa]